MSPSPLPDGSVRSAADVNEDIRRLWTDPRVRLSDEGRAALDRLYEEWAAAERAKLVEAA
jgi:hypothetical protein